MGVLKIYSKENRIHYFLENLSFWNFDIIKYNETTVMSSKNDVNTIDIAKEGQEYAITWHGPESKKIAKSYYNLFKNTEGAYIISSTHTFPPEPIGGTRSPSPPVDRKEVQAMKMKWFAYGFVICLALALITAVAFGAFGEDNAPTTTEPPTSTPKPTTTPAPTTAPPTSASPTTTPAPTTAPPTSTPPPSAETLLVQMQEGLVSSGIPDAVVSLEGDGEYVSVAYGYDGVTYPSETAVHSILSHYAGLTAQREVAPMLMATEAYGDGTQGTWYCLTAWITAYNRGYYTLDDVYERALATYATP